MGGQPVRGPEEAHPIGGAMACRVSIIVPTLNEDALIGEFLDYLRTSFPEAEIIVADGGSEDKTVNLADGTARVVHSPRGRGIQMNTGAAAATGDILWFLHADCRPSPDSIGLILDVLADDRVLGGGFRWALSGSKWYYKPFTALAHLKNKRRRNLFGDMGIFIRRDTFEKMGGYEDIPIFEEVEFNNRLRKLGETVILDTPLPSSDRKLLTEGPIRGFIKNDILKIAYSLGFSPEYLKKFY
ncbi:MAG: TIGR04283 family arsenosugar biosynthesis glycosyltransferase [Candidatus Eisenbacteria bacterium]